MTMIFKRPTGWGDTPSPSSIRGDPKAGVGRRLKGGVNDADSSPSALPSRISGGQCLHPRGSQGGCSSKTRQKKDGETLVMDKPVVVGELRDEGAEMGVGR